MSDAGALPLVAAAKDNDLEMVQMLLEHGANPNAQTDGAEVALSEAIERNRDMPSLIASYGGALPIHCLAWAGDMSPLLQQGDERGARLTLAFDPEQPYTAHIQSTGQVPFHVLSGSQHLLLPASPAEIATRSAYSPQ